MINTDWNETLFGGIRNVNRCLFSGGLPGSAETLLRSMEECLCSGDGLTPGSAFRSCGGMVAERVLALLGLQGTTWESEGGVTGVSVERNPYGIRRLYFNLI